MKKLFVLIFIFLFSCCFLYSQPPLLQWERQKFRSIGKLIAHNSEGNIVVCGTYGNDFSTDWVKVITIMYDTNGTELWSQLYEDTINGGINEPFDMVIDTFDNIYIAGRSHLTNDGLPITPEALLLKYDKHGNLLWKQEYGDSVNFQGGVWKIQLVENRDIYIAGYGQLITGSLNKSLLAKYDSSGQFHWGLVDTNVYETMGLDVETDKAGYVYLSGTTACCVPGYKMFVNKFDSSGTLVWNTILYDSARIFATTHCSAIDDSSSIYITGTTRDTTFSTGYDCAIAKVDSAGNKKWFTVYNSSSNPQYWEESKDLIISNNNLYITGWIGLPIGMNTFIIQLSLTGNINWWDTIGNEYSGFVKLMSDSIDVIAIGGGTNINGNDALLVSSYSLTGSENWRIQKEGRYNGNDLIKLNNSYYFTGDNTNIDPSTHDDSLFVFKFGDSLLTKIISIKPSEFHLSAFPNPVEDLLTIYLNGPNSKLSELKIFSCTGQIVYNKEIKSVEIISTAGWPTGLYFVQIRSDEYIISKKIIKQ